MQILIFTDLHGGLNGLLEKYQFNQPDLVVILGDLYNIEAKRIDSMFTCPILGIHGNHDNEDVFNDTNIIDFNGYEIETPIGIMIGLQGSSKYKPSQIYGYTQEESLCICKELPKANILFSHDGPYNKNKDDTHCGLKGIDWYIKNNKPNLLFYGHHHKYQNYQIDNTDCYCIYEIALVTIENNKVIDIKNFNL